MIQITTEDMFNEAEPMTAAELDEFKSTKGNHWCKISVREEHQASGIHMLMITNDQLDGIDHADSSKIWVSRDKDCTDMIPFYVDPKNKGTLWVYTSTQDQLWFFWSVDQPKEV